MNQIVTKGIVLRRVNYGEADRILTLLTPDQGKIVVLAKGVRKSNSKLAGSIELFTSGQITYLPGRGSIGTLISARLTKNFDNIVKDLERTQLTYGILKLFDTALEDGSGSEFYNLLEEALGFINNTSISLELIRMWFELQFLQLMGHGPNSDTETIKDAETDNFTFDFDSMAFVENENGNFNRNHIKLFLLALSNSPDQLNRITNLNELLDSLSEIAQLIMVNVGFNKL